MAEANAINKRSEDLEVLKVGGDPFVHFEVVGEEEMSIGLDDSDDNKLKITTGADPSSGTTLVIIDPSPATSLDADFLFLGNVFEVGQSAPGLAVGISSVNTDNTDGNSNSNLVAFVGGPSAGDPYLLFVVAATTRTYSFGVDNSDSDSVKITTAATAVTPSTGTIMWKMTEAAERTMPLQPAVLAYASVTVNNVTGNGAIYTVIFDTEVFDQNADYDNVTGIFTASVIGRYRFDVNITTIINVASTSASLSIVTNNRTYRAGHLNPNAIKTVPNFVSQTMSVLADMDAGHTATIQIVQAGGGADSNNLGGGAILDTYLSVQLEV